jgi:hypothetical protein
MNALKRALGLSVVGVLVAATAFAGAPLQGVYTMGQVDDGRYAESFAAAGEFATVGNVNQTYSDDLSNPLGYQWSYSCGSIQTATLLTDLGSQQQWQLIFDVQNAKFYLLGTGQPWFNGDASYTGVIDEWTETGWNILLSGSWVAWNSDVAWSGHFDAPYDQTCITWTANNAMASNYTYPDWVAGDCTTSRSYGTTGNHTDVTMDIHECLVPTEESTWGAIKQLYE